MFYKLRAMYRDTIYGPQLEIRKIRGTVESDAGDGFDPTMCLPQSRFDREAMYCELVELAQEKIAAEPLQELRTVASRGPSLQAVGTPGGAAAPSRILRRTGGTCAEHDKNLRVPCREIRREVPRHATAFGQGDGGGGRIVHDIGKLEELVQEPADTTFSPAGALVGHLLLGRDMVRDAARDSGIDADSLLRLEDAIIAHQRLPEWGRPSRR